MSKVQNFEFCPEHLISFPKGGECHLCKTNVSRLQNLMSGIEEREEEDGSGSLSWRKLLRQLQALEKEGKDLSGTVCISDSGSETLGSKLVIDDHGGFYIDGF
jgi:hypothetical protein